MEKKKKKKKTTTYVTLLMFDINYKLLKFKDIIILCCTDSYLTVYVSN